jgi:hypothetical protein
MMDAWCADSNLLFSRADFTLCTVSFRMVGVNGTNQALVTCMSELGGNEDEDFSAQDQGIHHELGHCLSIEATVRVGSSGCKICGKTISFRVGLRDSF